MLLIHYNKNNIKLVREQIVSSLPTYSSFYPHRCCTWMWRRCCRKRELRARVIHIGQPMQEKFPTNVIRNQKYNFVTFLPLVRFDTKH